MIVLKHIRYGSTPTVSLCGIRLEFGVWDDFGFTQESLKRYLNNEVKDIEVCDLCAKKQGEPIYKVSVIHHSAEYRRDHTVETAAVVDILPGETVLDLANRLIQPHHLGRDHNPFLDSIEIKIVKPVVESK